MTPVSNSTARLPERKYSPFRLTVHALKLIELLKKHEGLNKTTIVETAIREMAKNRGVHA